MSLNGTRRSAACEIWETASSSLTALTFLYIDAGIYDIYQGPGLCPLGGPNLLEIHLEDCQGLAHKLVVPRLQRLKIMNNAYLGERPLTPELSRQLSDLGSTVLSIPTL